MNQPIHQLPFNQQFQSGMEEERAIDLRKWLSFLIANLPLIANITLVVILIGAAYAFISEPVYEGTILVQVEDSINTPTGIMGGQPHPSDTKTSAAPEIEVLRSRAVVSRAVDNTHLFIDVQPRYFPGIGAWIAHGRNELSEPGLFGYGGYVWGAERADVSLFDVPQGLEGRVFLLTATGNDTFRITQQDAGIEMSGRTGTTLESMTSQGPIQLRVDYLAAKQGAQFLLTRTPRLVTVEGVQKALNILEKGKQSGVISVSLEGSDRNRIAAILGEIGRAYIRQNEVRKSEAAERSLAFLDKQLPGLKRDLESSEARYNKVRNKRGTFDLGEEAKGLLQQSISVQAKLFELTQKKEELLGRYQQEHPSMEPLTNQIRLVDRELESINARIRKLPDIEQDVLRLSRDMRVNTEVYTAVLSAAQQLRLASASKVGNVRMLDEAEKPVEPIKPRRKVILSFACIFGLALGLATALIKSAFYGRVDDPRQVEQLSGVPVVATILHSENQKQLSTKVRSKRKALSVLPHHTPQDSAVESLRRFRTFLQFSMRQASNNIIVMAGPTPEVGKSFISANFAVVLASIGKKVLLIDADLRTGHLHRYFGRKRKPGLSEAITEEIPADKAIQKGVVQDVDLISTGTLPNEPAELLANEKFGELLRSLSARYDVILIDTAPVLVVTDALIISRQAGATFNVVRDGVTTNRAIEEAVKQFNRAGVAVTGIVFNDQRATTMQYGCGYRTKSA
jgi:tyrosine-protein kinase Etk/Wzc